MTDQDTQVDRWLRRLKNWRPGAVVTLAVAFVLLLGALISASQSIWSLLPNLFSIWSEDADLVLRRQRLFDAMPWLRWIVYDPAGYDPYSGRFASQMSIREDLAVLRHYGFKGLITMTSRGTNGQIAKLAHEEGFNLIIVGVWDLRDTGEVRNALSAAPYADAYCLGHRGLNRYYNLRELADAIDRFHKEARRPVTTSELLTEYEETPGLARLGDFLFPDAHPSWLRDPDPVHCWQEVIKSGRRAAALTAGTPERLVLLKMISFPSAGAPGLTPETQLEFYRVVLREATDGTELPSRVMLSFMTAFDPTWKTNRQGWMDQERHTGLFTADRSPKSAISRLDWSLLH